MYINHKPLFSIMKIPIISDPTDLIIPSQNSIPVDSCRVAPLYTSPMEYCQCLGCP